jgi:hypothetical protein
MTEPGFDCRLTTNGLSIFAPTADQRYLLGADVFLRFIEGCRQAKARRATFRAICAIS